MISVHRAATVVLIAASPLLSACVEPPTAEDIVALERRSVDFIEVGKTTRTDIVLNFGTPTAVFEGERIFTHRLSMQASDGLRPVAHGAPGAQYGEPTWGNYHLVVVFDSAGVVERYELIDAGFSHSPTQSIQASQAPIQPRHGFDLT